jgi:putative ABC transport system permease protein
MIKTYFKIAVRNLVKNKAFSFINIVGLAVSMSVCLLIINIITDQKSYDQFHFNKDRIYRVLTFGKGDNDFKTATSAFPLAKKLKQEYPGIEQSASLVRNIGGDMLYEEKAASGGGYFADGELFKILDFKLTKGNVATALQHPFSLVISEDIAKQLFNNQDPIGKIVQFNDKGINPGGPEKGNRETEFGKFTITGVLQNPPGKTHLPFKLLASLSTLPALAIEKKVGFDANDWNNVWSNYTYVLLDKSRSETDLQNALDQIASTQFPKGGANNFQFKAQALDDITPQSDPIDNETNIFMPSTMLLMLSILGMIVMLSACLNYTNLSIARSLTRAKEVGIRKVSGATRGQIFLQFISEAIILSLVSLLLAVGLVQLLKIAFAGLWLNQFLNISFQQSLPLYLIFIAFSILIGFIAGVLPSIYISAFNPIVMMKNLGGVKLFKRLTLRKVLLVTQFCVSLIFIISTVVLYKQTNHILHFDYGFDKDNIVDVNLYKPENYQRFAQAVAVNKDVARVSACSFMPATGTNNGTQVFKAENLKDSMQADYMDIDSKFIGVMDLKLMAGKNLPEMPDTTGERYVIVNETFVKQFHYGSANSIVGQRLLLEGNTVEVVGVIKDFQFLDVSRKMEPLVFRNRPNTFGIAAIKVTGSHTAETIAFLESTWKKVNPHTKFEYEYFDQQLLSTHSFLTDIAKIVGFLSLMAVLISCFGLLGMATYTAQTRSKEISIRKVVGANVLQIIILLSKGFVKLLLIATVIATPLAYFLNNMWLQFFAYRVSISLGVLVTSILIMLFISSLTVFSQSWRAAFANPVKSLRSE